MATQGIRTLPELVNAIQSDQQLMRDFEQDPVGTLETVASNYVPDTGVYRILIVGLLFVAVIALAGAVALGLADKADSTVVTVCSSIATGAIGAVAGIFAQKPATS